MLNGTLRFGFSTDLTQNSILPFHFPKNQLIAHPYLGHPSISQKKFAIKSMLFSLSIWDLMGDGFDSCSLIESTISYNMDILALTYNMASYCVWRFFEIGLKVYIDSLFNVTMEMTS